MTSRSAADLDEARGLVDAALAESVDRSSHAVQPSGLGARLRAYAARVKLRGCSHVGPGTQVLGRVTCHGAGSITIGARVVLDASYAPICIFAHPDARIEIGDDVVIFGGTTLDAVEFVGLGQGARVGRLCRLMDSHFHGVTRRDSKPNPVPLRIGPRAWLGDSVIVTAGAAIGARTVVHSRAVVTRPFGPDLNLCGLPATIVRAPRAA